MNRNMRIQKAKQNKFLENSALDIKLIKAKCRQSFEDLFENNIEFDSYIWESNFNKMKNQKDQNPTLIIPKGFKAFIDSKLFKQLLKKIYQYLDLLVKYESEHQALKGQVSNKEKGDAHQLMTYEASHLQAKCKEISYIYMGILLSFGESKFIFRDQYFFETMIYFLGEILKSNFNEQQFMTIDQELNRIFRTNTFNLIKRRHEEDVMLKRFPDLKETKYEPSYFGVENLSKRISIQKRFRYSSNYHSEATTKIEKPLNMKKSTFNSIHSRSPLIASYYPSQQEKLYNFTKYNAKESFQKPLRSIRSTSFT